MTKIVSAINAMISNPKKISSVIPCDDEIFFLYMSKYKWSIMKTPSDTYNLWFYPGENSIEQLAAFHPSEWADFNHMVKYSSADIGTREAIDSFSELHTLVKEKAFGVDEALDEIISDHWVL
jgi:hypothetical protein